MKKILLFLMVFTQGLYVFSQKEIQLTFNPQTQNFDQDLNNIELRNGVKYQLKISGINSAVTKSKLKPETISFVSNTPEILKPIFQVSDNQSFDKLLAMAVSNAYGVDSVKFNESSRLTGLDDVFLSARDKFSDLKKIKEKADSLYKLTAHTPDTLKALFFRNGIRAYLNNASSDKELVFEMQKMIQYIIHAADLYEALISNYESDQLITDGLLEKSAEMQLYKKILTSENYLKYTGFILSSTKAKDHILSKPFTSKKDLIEVQTTLINSYKGDTMMNKALPFYTYRKFSFDFSTGFFYNNLYEETYYLDPNEEAGFNQIKTEETFEGDIALGGMGSFTYKFDSFTKLGLGMGAALSPLDGKTRYLFGVTGLFGRERQLAFHAGLAVAKYKTLSTSVDVSDEGVTSIPISNTTIPTYSKVQSGWFFGLGYNITSRKK